MRVRLYMHVRVRIVCLCEWLPAPTTLQAPAAHCTLVQIPDSFAHCYNLREFNTLQLNATHVQHSSARSSKPPHSIGDCYYLLELIFNTLQYCNTLELTCNTALCARRNPLLVLTTATIYANSSATHCNTATLCNTRATQHCALVEVPESIGDCYNLRELILNNNKLITLPHGIGSCTALTDLRLHENLLEELPATLGI